MTVLVNDRRLTYAGNDVATVFPGPRAFQAVHIYATLINDTTSVRTALVLGVNFEVTNLGLTETVVTLAEAPATGYTLELLRTLPIVQEARFTNQGQFFAKLHEDEFDYVTMILQQIADDLAQAGGESLIDIINALIENEDFWALLQQLITNTFDVGDQILILGILSYLIPQFTIADTTGTVDKTKNSGLIHCTNALPTTVTIRECTGNPDLDFRTGSFMTFQQKTVGGQVTLVEDVGMLDFKVPLGFLAKTRALNSKISAVCELATIDGSLWTLSGDLAIDTASSAGSALVTVTSDTGAIPIDTGAGDYFRIELSEDITDWDFTNEPLEGYATTFRLRITQHPSAAKTVAWSASFLWAGGTPPSVSTGLGAVDELVATTYDQGTTWLCELTKAFA